MNVLDMILEEIEDRKSYHEELLYQRDDYEIQKMYCEEELNWIRDTIHSHMNDVTDTNVGSKIPPEGTVKVQELIDKFRDMKERGTLLTGSSVTQEDIFIQIIGIIADVAMN